MIIEGVRESFEQIAFTPSIVETLNIECLKPFLSAEILARQKPASPE